MSSRLWNFGLAVTLFLAAIYFARERPGVDPGKPANEKAPGITTSRGHAPRPRLAGTRASVGSDTLSNLMALWAEGFAKRYPNVRIHLEGKGSSTAPPALIWGTAQLGPMVRPMRKTEEGEFERRHGYRPTQVKVAMDVIVVLVHKDNPVEELTLPQVDAVFSSTRRAGFERDVATWGELGLTGEWAEKTISLHGRISTSSAYGSFKERALSRGEYKWSVKEHPGSASVVQSVAEDRHAIGYAGFGHATPGVKMLRLAEKAGGPYGAPEIGSIHAGKYPLARHLYIYIAWPPGKPLDPVVREFLRYALSQEGQLAVLRDGFLPLDPATEEEERLKLGDGVPGGARL